MPTALSSPRQSVACRHVCGSEGPQGPENREACHCSKQRSPEIEEASLPEHCSRQLGCGVHWRGQGKDRSACLSIAADNLWAVEYTVCCCCVPCCALLTQIDMGDLVSPIAPYYDLYRAHLSMTREKFFNEVG